ncbi:hypothetical protein DFQ27_006526 [Actinomortierella ambigua]|uniref:Uncharacterized protein n=1 Tax=Actinomortierella ambigua TaxID=1343610 RepID=A0A9P6PW23_9FUNG|nr:hypothetical protein DFQ27_006526 [Actinomortierella ambigua]
MTTDEPASPLPSASLPTTPSSMRASYTIGTKSHAYTPPAKPSSPSRSNSARILQPSDDDAAAAAPPSPSSIVSSGHLRHKSLDKTPSPVQSTNSNSNICPNGEEGAAAQVPLEQDPDLDATGSSSSAAAAAAEAASLDISTAASEPSGSTSQQQLPSSPKRASIVRAASMKQQQGSSSPLVGDPSPAAAGLPSASLSRHASLTLKSRRKADRDSIGSSLSLVSQLQGQQQQQQQQSQLPSPSPSPQTAQRPHRMLNRQQQSLHGQHSASTSISSSVGLADEGSEELVPGTPTSISSFSSLNSEREKVPTSTNGRLRSNRNSVALIENRNIHALSSNLAMIQSPTKSEFGNGAASEELLSVIAQKEARIQQLREDLETNLQELSQLKDQWSKRMLEERTRQQAEANASLQMENGGGASSLVPNRLSTAAIWGTVVGSVSQLSGASSGLSIHHVSPYTPTLATASPTTMTPTSAAASAGQTQSNGNAQNSGLASARSSTSSIGRGVGGVEGGSLASNASRPTSPLPTYLSGFSGLHGPTQPSKDSGINGHHHHHHHHHAHQQLAQHPRKVGDRTSVSSQSTVSSALSSSSCAGGDVPTSFEPGHSHTSSIGSGSMLSTSPSSTSGGNALRDTRERQRPKRESSGLFIPVEAEEVLVNTGRALFKGFGSLIGGIRTVVNDVAESDRFQHSRQRTMDMVNGLAQTAADVLPLPSQDEIYYHHQRLQLLDEEEEAALSRQLRKEQLGDDDHHDQLPEAALKAREQQRRARAMERAALRRQGSSSSSGSPSPTSRRSSSSLRSQRKTTVGGAGGRRRMSSEHEEDDSSKSVDLLGIHDSPEPSKTLSPMASSSSLLVVTADGEEDEEAHHWDMGLEAEPDLLKMLETTTTTTSTTNNNTTATTTTTVSEVDLLHDTPLLPAVVASKKNE